MRLGNGPYLWSSADDFLRYPSLDVCFITDTEHI